MKMGMWGGNVRMGKKCITVRGGRKLKTKYLFHNFT